jgi:hypothetical protein
MIVCGDWDVKNFVGNFVYSEGIFLEKLSKKLVYQNPSWTIRGPFGCRIVQAGALC